MNIKIATVGLAHPFEVGYDQAENLLATTVRTLEEQGISCTIHMDPIVRDDPAVSRWYDITKRIVCDIDERISLHDFRMVPGFTHTNLIFDIAVPFENKIPEDKLKNLIGSKISEIDSTFFTVITIDRI